MTSLAEENYLKAIYKLHEKKGAMVSTSALAETLGINAASVTDFIKKMAAKKLISYQKSKGVSLTEQGRLIALTIIRKHRLWEVFLVEKLGFAWDEVHDLAEQLEHVQGEALIDRLDNFLGHPRFDPHGDPIPDAQGHWTFRQQVRVSLLQPGEKGILTGVDDHATPFLQYLDQIGVALGIELLLLHRTEYDQSVQVRISGSVRLS